MKLPLIFLLVCCTAFTSSKSISNEICTDLIEAEFDLVPAGVWDNVKDCAKGVVNAVLELGADLAESTNGAIINALRLKDLVLKCYNAGGKVQQAACVVKNAGEFKRTISQVIDDAQELYSILKEKGVILVDAVKSCRIRDPETMFYFEVIAAQVEQCPAL
ncbi:uncharacterized protein LOC129612077 [Condylostylus longicornis]|uniref:uncharacterized protein LOC129612077 n=1 Tax=Condylostylus longicornis TaxID=2530218 RepID=UPI00244E3F9D|nr:uncharacterized protein LOC129612077 [Condylostylus longicornis]